MECEEQDCRNSGDRNFECIHRDGSIQPPGGYLEGSYTITLHS